MGVIHKLKPDVLKYIIESKQKNPALSCRQLTLAILEQFQIKVSKSSINSIFKENNLSLPVGRRAKFKKVKFNLPVLPVIEETRSVTVSSPVKEVSLPKIDPPVEPDSQEKRINEAEVWARQLQEEERIRIEKKRACDEAAQNVLQAKRLEDEAAEKIQKERIAQEQALIAQKKQPVKLDQVQNFIEPKQPVHKIKVFAAERIVFNELPQERACSGAILLRVLDNLIGGSQKINEVLTAALGGQPQDYLNLTRALIFKSLFNQDNFLGLGDLIGVIYPPEKLDSYAAQINQLPGINFELAKTIADVFTQAKGLKINFSDASAINLDGQLHSSWSTFWFPANFAVAGKELKTNLEQCFLQDKKLVLFSAPGYDVLPKDFFRLISNMLDDIRPVNLAIFGNELNELENIPLDQETKYSLIFGLWPWQFTSSRRVKRIGDFSMQYIPEIDQNLYLGEIEIELLQLTTNRSLTLKGCAIKTNLVEKIRLVVLSTDPQEDDLAGLCALYLSHWPNFDEAFQDFSRKIELFTYAGKEQKSLPKDSFQIKTEAFNFDVANIFTSYIQMLDLYLRWYFLPLDYTEKDLNFMVKNFYNLHVGLVLKNNKLIAKIQGSSEDQLRKDLEYLVRRLNERRIFTSGGQRLWLESVFI